MRLVRFSKLVAAACLTALLLGCRSNPTYDTLTTLLPWTKQYAAITPGIEYLWVSVDGQASVMALGERTVQGVGAQQSVHEHWYTGQGEMLYTVNGRIAQALGFTHELRGQSPGAPAWRDVLGSTREIQWTRQLDLMPGYRYGVTDTVVTQRTNAPKHVPEGVPAQAQWVTDLVGSKGDDGLAWWYVQKFAVLDDHVVYSEQCVAKGLCLQMRPLGVVVPLK